VCEFTTRVESQLHQMIWIEEVDYGSWLAAGVYRAGNPNRVGVEINDEEAEALNSQLLSLTGGTWWWICDKD